jgi:hypothetical protein
MQQLLKTTQYVRELWALNVTIICIMCIFPFNAYITCLQLIILVLVATQSQVQSQDLNTLIVIRECCTNLYMTYLNIQSPQLKLTGRRKKQFKSKKTLAMYKTKKHLFSVYTNIQWWPPSSQWLQPAFCA